jgi:hypothetical protein
MFRRLGRRGGLFAGAIITAGLTGIVATASAGTASAISTTGTPAPTAKTVSHGAPPGASQDHLRNIPERVSSTGTQTYSGTFGGLVMTRNATHMDVYLTHPDARTEHQLAAEAPAGTITFAHTPHSLKFLDSLHQTVTNQFYTLRAAGIQLETWAPEIQTGREIIEVKDLNPAKAKILDSRFGASNIEVQNISGDGMGPAATDRAYDKAPWNSGDFIWDGSGGCTAGFGVRINGYDGQITADHCFPYKATISNYDADCGCGSNTELGYISQNDNRSGGSDTEVIFTTNGGSSGLMFNGDPGTQSTYAVSGWADNPVGDYVCNSGAFSGTVCGIQIKNNNTCTTETGEGNRYVCHLIWALSYDNTIANETGDSGGPVYRVINGSIYAVGDVVGYKLSGNSPEYPVACQYNKGEICTADLFYNAMDYILSTYKATLITG